MNIGALLFNPKGAVGKSAFLTGAVILVVVGFLTAMAPLVNPLLGVLAFFVGLVAIYCWVALWIKRLHGAGASGWWTVLIVLGWIIVDSVVEFAVLGALGIDFAGMMSGGGDFAEMMAQMEAMTEQVLLPTSISSAIVSLAVALGLNAILPAGREANRAVEDDQSPPSGPPES
ncbi:MAG: DUF805 domain-containing protein [Oceanicaulis sp.]